MRTTAFGDESAAKAPQCIFVSDLNVIGLDPSGVMRARCVQTSKWLGYNKNPYTTTLSTGLRLAQP